MKREMTIEDFDAANNVRRQMHDYRQKVTAWQKEASAKKKSLEAEESDIQKRCKHWFTEHHRDPSGGRDSFDECLICGKQWKNL